MQPALAVGLAYGVNPAKSPSAKPVGWAFWTIDLVPGELGYHGHIHMLIGMDTAGRIAGVIVDINRPNEKARIVP